MMMMMLVWTLTADVDGSTLNVIADVVDAATLVQSDISDRQMPDDQLRASRYHVTNRHSAILLYHTRNITIGTLYSWYSKEKTGWVGVAMVYQLHVIHTKASAEILTSKISKLVWNFDPDPHTREGLRRSSHTSHL